MIIKDFEYSRVFVEPGPFGQKKASPYTPKYYMVLYNNPDAFLDYKAIKVRADIIIPDLLYPALRSVLPEKILKTDGSEVYLFNVGNLGNIYNVPIGYLQITPNYFKFCIVDLRTIGRESHFYGLQLSMENWVDSDDTKSYTLVDYEEDELYKALHNGTVEYNNLWKGKEDRKNNPHIWEDLVKSEKD